MLRVLDCSSISYMPVRGGKPFGEYTMSVRFYKRAGVKGWQTWYMNLFAKSPKTLEQCCTQIRTTATDAKIGAWHNRRHARAW